MALSNPTQVNMPLKSINHMFLALFNFMYNDWKIVPNQNNYSNLQNTKLIDFFCSLLIVVLQILDDTVFPFVLMPLGKAWIHFSPLT